MAVLIALQAFPVCWRERHDARVAQHLERVADSIAAESDSAEDAAALIAIGENESAFSIRVQLGPTGSGALSDWQLEHAERRYPGPFIGLEPEPIRNAAHAALGIWRHSWQCGPRLADRFTAYAAAKCGSHWPTLGTRVGSYRFARGILAREQGKQ
jgi:hypothetical protein